MEPSPYLVTLTSPSCGGKSYLLSYIRDGAKIPCIVSTTTRPKRISETNGVDYFFISHNESIELERSNQFIEMITYGGIRYGVTKNEFRAKMQKGLCFLIIEPQGIKNYQAPILEFGAKHFRVWVETALSIRIARLKKRAINDMLAAKGNFDSELKTMKSYLDRMENTFTEESDWFRKLSWDRIVYGENDPGQNLKLILGDLEVLHAATEFSECRR